MTKSMNLKVYKFPAAAGIFHMLSIVNKYIFVYTNTLLQTKIIVNIQTDEMLKKLLTHL